MHQSKESPLRFVEVEHKFIVDPEFDVAAFTKQVTSLAPFKSGVISVNDTYFVLASQSDRVFRHRYDNEMQHLTVKSIAGDSEQRVEVNLDLGQTAGNQFDAVSAFLQTFGVTWSGTLRKDVRAFYFKDCEIVYYRASNGVSSVDCVEFEATAKNDLESALKTLESYETRVGFGRRQRAKESLFELLLLPLMPEELRRKFREAKAKG